MEEDLKEMLGKRPDELEGETLKLFNAIMKIADERDELKLKCKELKEIEKSHRKENGELRIKLDDKETELQILKDDIKADEIMYKDELIENYIPVSLVKEKIEEINKAYEDSKDENGESQYYYPDYTIRVLEELLEKRK